MAFDSAQLVALFRLHAAANEARLGPVADEAAPESDGKPISAGPFGHRESPIRLPREERPAMSGSAPAEQQIRTWRIRPVSKQGLVRRRSRQREGLSHDRLPVFCERDLHFETPSPPLR
jgi:hypothetical protein